MKIRILCSIAVASLLYILASYSASAQLTECTLNGSVADASGSVQHAAILVTNEGTGITRSAAGNMDGTFTIPDLPPGLYTVQVKVQGYKAFEQRGVELNVGKTSEVNVRLEIGQVDQTVEVNADQARVPVSTDGRLSDTLEKNQITGLPIPGRDVFFLTSLSAGATNIPGASASGKLADSPAVAVNGNRFRGNNYVLDGSMDTYILEEGTPAIMPSLDSIEEVQVQTDNFSSEYGRGNGSVVNIRTRSGTNDFHGRVWEYQKNAVFNAVNRFSITGKPAPLVFNQFGGNLGGPVFKKKTFFFGSYEGTRDARGTPSSFQVETPEFRNYVAQKYPSSIAAALLTKFPAPTPVRVGTGYLGEVDLDGIPAAGTDEVNIRDDLRFDQYIVRIDHTFNQQKDTLSGRWIAEYDHDNGTATTWYPGNAMRGFADPTHFFYGNFNLGETHVFEKPMVNDARFSFNNVIFAYDNPYEQYPSIRITGITAGFGGSSLGSRLRTYEARDTLSINHGGHLIRAGFELRSLFIGFNLGQPQAGEFDFSGLNTFATDNPYVQTLVVTPSTGKPAEQERDYSIHEGALFIQDDWKVTHRLTLTLGGRDDYFGDPSERRGEITSIILGSGSTWDEQFANAAVGHVGHLFHPSARNFSPRVGLAYDPLGDGKSTIRAGYSLAYEPIHGHTALGGTSNPPYAISAVLWPANGYGTTIDYGIPVPFNPEFKTTLNAQGGVVAPVGESAIRISPWLINPKLKTQYSESYFLNLQREVAKSWIVELGYVGTNGINLEHRDDVNRFDGDELVNNGKAKRINQNWAAINYVMNGVTSSYNAFTAEVRHQVATGFTLQANYRWSKWIDTNSDTNMASFGDNADGSVGSQNVNCLKCERGLSEFDIPRRFTASAVWVPQFSNRNGMVASLYKNWQISAIVSAQSGRPFSPYCSAQSNLSGDLSGRLINLGCDYNLDGGGGIGGGFYDRPDTPAKGAVKSSFKQKDFINGLYSPSVFPQPTLGTDGTLGRDVYRGPRQTTTNLALGRNFNFGENRLFQFRADAFNAFNNVNLFLPNNDLALALKPDGTYSSTSVFGKSTQAFDPRVLQLSAKIVF
jgi:hypothetical protein